MLIAALGSGVYTQTFQTVWTVSGQIVFSSSENIIVDTSTLGWYNLLDIMHVCAGKTIVLL